MNKSAEQYRRDNLINAGIPFSEIIVCESRIPKLKPLKELGPIAFIDDQPKNVRAGIEAGVANVGFVDLERRYNIIEGANKGENILEVTKIILSNINA